MDDVKMVRSIRLDKVDLSDKRYVRGGIIPVTNKGAYFGVGRSDLRLTDFGGHREIKDRDILETVMREYGEESGNVFGILDRQKLLKCVSLDGVDTLEILLPVEENFEYQSGIRRLENEEISDLRYLTARELEILLDDPIHGQLGSPSQLMYNRLFETLYVNKRALLGLFHETL